MRILNFKVDAQTLSAEGDFSNIVAGTKNYLVAKFEFSEEWAGCQKVASFWNRGGEYPVKIERGQCMIPHKALTERCFKVSVKGGRIDGYRINTNKFKVKQEVN